MLQLWKTDAQNLFKRIEKTCVQLGSQCEFISWIPVYQSLFGNGFGHCLFPGIEMWFLLLISVDEKDGIIHRHSQLKRCGNTLCDKGDGSHHEIGPHVEECRKDKDDEKDDDFEIAS